MVDYKCFSCKKKISDSLMGRRVRCPYCGSKMLFKTRSQPTVVEAI